MPNFTPEVMTLSWRYSNECIIIINVSPLRGEKLQNQSLSKLNAGALRCLPVKQHSVILCRHVDLHVLHS